MKAQLAAPEIEPAVLGGAGFEFNDLVHVILPSPFGNHWVAVFEVDFGKAKVHGRLFPGFVQGEHQTRALGFVPRFEALEGFRGVVEGVINALAPEE